MNFKELTVSKIISEFPKKIITGLFTRWTNLKNINKGFVVKTLQSNNDQKIFDSIQKNQV